MTRTSFAVVALLALASFARADSCPVAQPHPLTSPQIAAIRGNWAEAESLYRDALAKSPSDQQLAAGLVGTLLSEQKIDEASATVEAALRKDPQSPALLTALARVEHRQGLPWEEQKTLNAAQVHGVCYAPLHLALARYFRFNSHYATALSQLSLARQLDPYDPTIDRAWRKSLPLDQRIDQLKTRLAGASIGAKAAMESELSMLESREKNQGACHLVAPIHKPTDIPFAPVRAPGGALRAWGLEVAINGRKSNLLIDTGATGIYINRSLAKKAKLTPLVRRSASGIGDKGPQPGYLAEADSIKVGGLEFKNCLVEVSDSRDIANTDGLIGTDVFSHFLVTLDFPWLKLTLAPLPPYPGTAATPESLNTGRENRGPHDRYIAPEMKDWIKVYRVGHALILPGVMNRKKVGLFVIDTGANRSVISPAAASSVSKIHKESGARVSGISGPVKTIYYASGFSVRFGNLEQKSARIPVFDISGVSRGLGAEISGLLGEDTLGVLVVRIDYRDGLMKLEYSPHRGYQSY